MAPDGVTAIREKSKLMEEALRAGDVDGLVELLAEDVVIMSPATPLVVGRESTYSNSCELLV